jgi:dihydroflavonol-4-reductase
MSNGRRTFLTGATGFIGRRVARLLLARGDTVTCLVRNPDRATSLEADGARVVVGDVTDRDAMTGGLEGADAAIHMAAIYDIGVVDAALLRRTNVDGTRVFLECAREQGTARTVHVSSTAALGPAPAGGMGSVDAEWHGPYPSVYHETKTEAHHLARAARAVMPGLVITCPAFGYGPGDEGPAGRFIHDLVRSRVPGLLSEPGWYSYVHVDDIAEGIVASLERGTAGSIYGLTGEDASINDFAIRVARLAGRRPPPLRMPASLALGFGSVLDAVSKVTGLRFTISRESAKVSRYRWIHDGSRTTSELGWRARGLDEGLRETVSWYRDNGRKEG